MRLLAFREEVIDVPPQLSARTRAFATGQGRKTDATDAHSVALVGTRMSGLRPVAKDEQLAMLRIRVDRRRSLGEDHTRTVCQLHQARQIALGCSESADILSWVPSSSRGRPGGS